jgi:protein TonB
MSSLNLFGKEWLNIVFENRNKLYGAYKLRQESTKTTFMSLAIGVGMISLIFGSSYLYASKSDPTIIIVNIPEDPIVPNLIDPIEKNEPTNEKPIGTSDDDTKAAATKKDVIKNVKLIEMQATDDDKAKNEDLTAQNQFNDNTNSGQDNIEANENGSLNTDGSKSGTENIDKGLDKTGVGSTSGTKEYKPNDIVKLVQHKAMPNEGYDKFFNSFVKKFSNQNINATSGEISVKLRFVVEKDGSLTDIQILDDKYGIGDEAIRVLKSMPKWKAAQHNGRTVRSMFTLPIKVKINN